MDPSENTKQPDQTPGTPPTPHYNPFGPAPDSVCLRDQPPATPPTPHYNPFGSAPDPEKDPREIWLPHQNPLIWPTLRDILSQSTKSPLELQTMINDILALTSKKKKFQTENQLPFPTFTGLEFGEPFFEETLPFMKALILELPELFPTKMFHLVSFDQGEISLTRKQAACLLACSTLGLFWTHRGNSKYEWPHFNVVYLFTSKWGSMYHFALCILHYFQRISKEMPKGNVIYSRTSINKLNHPDYATSQKQLTSVTLSERLIEDFTEHPFHADFANEFIGGGVLEGGCVQEEILFVLKPECLVSMLLCSKMEPNEAIIISGAERFSKYKGYGGAFQFDGAFYDTTERNDQLDCIDNHILGIDAVMSRQFAPTNIDRDINKLFVALHGATQSKDKTFVTGHWGCGAFGGDKELKAVQQIIAASEAGFSLVYCYFHDKKFEKCLHKFLNTTASHNVTVSQLYGALCDFPPPSHFREGSAVFKFLRKKLKEQAEEVVGCL